MNDIKKKDLSVGKIVYSLSAPFIGICTVALPVQAVVACLALCLIKDFKRSTATHCRVRNYLPSISSAIGGYTPQVYIWRICVALHVGPRFLGALTYYHQYKSYRVTSHPTLFSFLVTLNAALNFLEDACLLGLSFVSSTETYSIHENSFIGFMVFSELYMILQCCLFRWSRSIPKMMPKNQRSFNYKVTFLVINLVAFGVAAYLFLRHNAYCEPLVYTAFAFFEYVVVFSNIAFHSTQIMDVERGRIVYIDTAESDNSKTD